MSPKVFLKSFKKHKNANKMSKTQKLDFQNVGIRQKMSKNKGMLGRGRSRSEGLEEIVVCLLVVC